MSPAVDNLPYDYVIIYGVTSASSVNADKNGTTTSITEVTFTQSLQVSTKYLSSIENRTIFTLSGLICLQSLSPVVCTTLKEGQQNYYYYYYYCYYYY